MIQDGIQDAVLLDSFLMMGQSNMAGRGEFDEVKPIRNILCYMLRMGRWQPMREPVNPDRPVFEGQFHSGVSLASTFADCYAKQYGRPVGLIPCADGGTQISQWQPGEPNFDHAVMLARLAMRTSRLKAVLWHQGESDCTSDAQVNAYYNRFVTMVTALRKELGFPVPVIIGQIPQNIGARWNSCGREKKLNAVLEKLAQDVPGCVLVSSEGLELKEDGVHFNSASLQIFGQRYFEAYQALVK